MAEERSQRDKLSSYFYDLSKLSYAALVLGAAVQLVSTGHPDYLKLLSLMLFGGITTGAIALLAYKLSNAK